MSIEEHFSHRCDIYHVMVSPVSPGYGLPGAPKFSYPDAPDITACPCKFCVKGGSVMVVQATPQANLEARVKLTLPAGTDVRINDKIVDCATGLVYTAEVPQDIHGHHMFVMVARRDKDRYM